MQKKKKGNKIRNLGQPSIRAKEIFINQFPEPQEICLQATQAMVFLL